ncbi:hypothetical protein CMUS01_11649 [Colletotrichum musicola]|uniref:Uncharacterized protein n=1 Tax=Colletotrichum musicola TaxID=2175873 RepID=A0A8H6JW85_9PEZI|nr:hypothetical protein CMUS01_11649 [Colletotrichum musicola]
MSALHMRHRGGTGSVHADGTSPQPSMFPGMGLGRRRGQSGAFHVLRMELRRADGFERGAVQRRSRALSVVAEPCLRTRGRVGFLATRDTPPTSDDSQRKRAAAYLNADTVCDWDVADASQATPPVATSACQVDPASSRRCIRANTGPKAELPDGRDTGSFQLWR